LTEDEDRPPVIISGGSVNLWDVYPANFPAKGRGTWYDINKDQETWDLKYGTGWKSVDRMTLNLVNIEVVESTKCKYVSQIHDVYTFDLELTANSMVRMSIVDGNLRAVFSGAVRKAKKENNLDFFITADGNGANKLKLKRISFTDVGNNVVDCRFKDHHPIITVLQVPPTAAMKK